MVTGMHSRGAARCRKCGRALAVRLSDDREIVPIGSVDGCPCGSTSFRLLGSSDAFD